MGLKQLIFNYVLRRRPARQVAFPRLEKVRSVLIIREDVSPSNDLAVRSVVQELRRQRIIVQVFGYDPKLFNLFGVPNGEARNLLERFDFDLLLDLTSKPMLQLEHAVLAANARFKIGTRERADLYDLVVAMPETTPTDEAYSHIMYFLNTIQSADNDENEESSTSAAQ